MSDLPAGWATAFLPQMVASGGVFSDGDWVESKDQDPEGDVRLIQLADVGEGYYRDRSSRFLTMTKPESTDEVGVRTQRQATNPTGTMELLSTNVSAGGHLSGASLSHAPPSRHRLR
jgi:hypothetical protein